MRRRPPSVPQVPCILAGIVGLASPAASQNPLTFDPETGISSACEGEAFREFDYWLGSWIVRNEDGQEVGRNVVTRLSHGCGLLEEWTPATGPKGSSLNFRDPATGRWHQVWVGGGGLILRLEGGLEDGAMTLSGSRPAAGGTTVHERIRWSALPDGRVEQLWQRATDPAGGWETVFRGLYEREAGPDATDLVLRPRDGRPARAPATSTPAGEPERVAPALAPPPPGV